jgi:large subunit ribosomal protein L6
MVKNDYKEIIKLPEGVTAHVQGKVVTCKGPKGENSREVAATGVNVFLEGHHLVLEAKNATQQQKNLLFTYKAHLSNLVKGASEGFTYKLKICSGHFPMSVGIKGKTFEIKNFIGEKVPRTLTLKEGAHVKIEGDIIEITSTDKEIAGQIAGDIEKLSRRPGFDKRIFQDGIYIINKAGKEM